MFKKIYLWWKDRHFRHLKKRSPEEIFSDVYKNNIWGGEKGVFYSGAGTRNPNTSIYIDKLRDFIRQHQIRSILEIGCGDFEIMDKVLAGINIRYEGTDVVDDLIYHNNRTFGNDLISFKKINAIDQELPSADLIIIRQVLQHLSNAQIVSILSKLTKFKYAFITEHVPITENVDYNLDKITGPHIRMRVNSGVFIDHPPFNIKNSRILFEYREDDPVKGKMIRAVMRTYLIEN